MGPTQIPLSEQAPAAPVKTPRRRRPLGRLMRIATGWIDNAYLASDISADEPQRVDWVRVIPFFAVHFVCLAAFLPGVGVSGWALGVCAFLYFARMFAITGFYHRYFSHRTFKTSRAFQFVMAFWGNTSAQRGPLWWAAHHRDHHTHSDQEEDVHSPHQHSFLWSHMLWITSRPNFLTKFHRVPDLMKFPELKFLDRVDLLAPALLGVGTFFLGMGLQAMGANTNGWQMLIWGFFISTVLLFHGTCTINSLSHLIGKKRYATTDESRNSFILALITLGEGWHNNHHHYPASTRQGFRWWEIDITYYGLKMLSWTGLIRDLKPVPEKALNARRLDRAAT